MTGICALCQREGMRLTAHHLIPKTRHRNKRVKRDIDKSERLQVVGVCRPCHSHIHAVFSEKELEREYNTLEKIAGHPEMRKFTAWIRKRKFGAELRVS